MVITAQMRDEMKQLEDDARFMQELEEKQRKEMIEAEQKEMTPAEKQEKEIASRKLVSDPIAQAAYVLSNLYEDTRINGLAPGIDVGLIEESIKGKRS
jgi:hypothetical protein